MLSLGPAWFRSRRAFPGRRLATWPRGSGHATIPCAVFDPADPGSDRSDGSGPGVPPGAAAVDPLPGTSRISSAEEQLWSELSAKAEQDIAAFLRRNETATV